MGDNDYVKDGLLFMIGEMNLLNCRGLLCLLWCDLKSPFDESAIDPTFGINPTWDFLLPIQLMSIGGIE